MYWHSHEMVFGFAVAVIAGFLLTAVGNWTQRETIVGVPLLALSGLWVAGRFAVLFAQFLPRGVPAIVDLSFLPILGFVLARPLIAARNRRNFVMLAVLGALWLANLAVHIDALGFGLSGWRRRGSLVAADVVVFVIVVMAARVFPMFTRNATGATTIRGIPLLERASLIAMAILTACDAAYPDSRVAALMAGMTGVVVAAQAIHWGAQYSFKTPLLWILHVGYAWIPIGLGLRALAAFTTHVPVTAGTHALTVGAIGSLTLGMMSRVALGHTGRMLVATRAVALSFVLITLAAIVRVGTPIFHRAWYRGAVMTAGIAWTAAFILFLAVYTPVLFAPRVDGKAG